MDVIALHQAGFAGAVAPLGTALTAEQLEALWRISPAPTLCFDGDEAGARAAARSAETCLPLITPERTLLFARLPSGQDPDSLVRRGGAAAFQSVLEAARPLVQTLFELLRAGTGEGPEARAALRARLDAAAGRIADKTLASEYRGALRTMFFDQARPRTRPKPATRTARTTAQPDATQSERARCLTALLLRHPHLLRDTEEAFAALDLPPALARIRESVLHLGDHAALDSAALLDHLTSSGLGDDARLALSEVMPLPASARPEAMPAEAEGEWWHLFGLLRGLSRLDEEVADAARAFERDGTDAAQRRLIGLRTAWLDLVALDPET